MHAFMSSSADYLPIKWALFTIYIVQLVAFRFDRTILVRISRRRTAF